MSQAGSTAGVPPPAAGRTPQPVLTFARHLHRHAARRRPQVHPAAARAEGQPGLLGVPLEGAHRGQLLEHHEESQLLYVPDPDGVRDAV